MLEVIEIRSPVHSTASVPSRELSNYFSSDFHRKGNTICTYDAPEIVHQVTLFCTEVMKVLLLYLASICPILGAGRRGILSLLPSTDTPAECANFERVSETLAQLVEHRPFKALVLGSSPRGLTNPLQPLEPRSSGLRNCS
jgi:hypothetical protein